MKIPKKGRLRKETLKKQYKERLKTNQKGKIKDTGKGKIKLSRSLNMPNPSQQSVRSGSYLHMILPPNLSVPDKLHRGVILAAVSVGVNPLCSFSLLDGLLVVVTVEDVYDGPLRFEEARAKMVLEGRGVFSGRSPTRAPKGLLGSGQWPDPDPTRECGSKSQPQPVDQGSTRV